MGTTVLITQGLSNVRDAIALARRDMTPGEFVFHACHSSPLSPLATLADLFSVQPDAGGPLLVEWTLQRALETGAGIVWPQRSLETFAAAADRFDAHGIRLMLPTRDAGTLAVLADKARANAVLDPLGVPLPFAVPFRGQDGFDAALASVPAGRTPCVKPSKGIYGSGFRILKAPKASAMLHGDPYALMTVAPEAYRAALAADAQSTFLMMELLEGEERSVDLLCRDGAVLMAVSRVKRVDRRQPWQQLDLDPEALGIARAVAAAFGLSGIVNIQTRERLTEAGPEQVFLEVNARMSGGMAMVSEAGANLPLHALRAALDPSYVPDAALTTGLAVTMVEAPMTLGFAPAPPQAADLAA